jgi:hypothetical protein
MPNKPADEFQPAFKRVAQTNDFDDAFACVAMLADKTVAEIRQIAIDKFGLPIRGPWFAHEEMITGLCAQVRWVATVYKEAARIADVPDIAILLIDYNPRMEVGRHVLFHRQKAAGGVEYIIDPAYWITEPSKQIHNDVKSIKPPFWYMGLHQMKAVGK